MKTLLLLRHAKSSWDDRALPDHDRPLASRGQNAARRMASHVERERIRVDLVLCSSATRARQTLDAVTRALGKKVDVRVEDALYTADAEDLLARLHGVGEAIGTVLLVGHNPALQDLAVNLVADGEGVAMKNLHEKYPTGALATITIGTSWAEADRAVGYLESLVTPRELPD